MYNDKLPSYTAIAALNDDPIFNFTKGIEPEKVVHPSHYNWFGIECLDVAEHFGFNLGNAIKYIWRNGRKKDEDSVTDLKKAIFYIQREIDRIEKEHNGCQ